MQAGRANASARVMIEVSEVVKFFETGPLGIECVEAPGGLHLLEPVCWPEVLDPDTGRAVPAGTPGELVLTTFRRSASPLIRYRTGDLVCVDPAPCACGRALVRLQGVRRLLLVVPTVYIAACCWEARLIVNPSITTQIMIGAILIVTMAARPNGLLGARRVEIV